MSFQPTRRALLAQGVPAAALAGLFGAPLLAQQTAPPTEPPAGQQPPSKSLVDQLLQKAYQDGQYALPPLPYAYDALEPHIDAQTMQLHHDVHHQGYVNGLNKTLSSLSDFRGGAEADMVQLEALERNLTFNGGGHLLHTLFWATMGPDAGGKPSGALAQAIQRDFESFDAFKKYFTNVATSVKGSGWSLLAYEPLGDKLLVLGLNAHDLRLIAGAQPLLPLDVWEHAYYLKYQSKRAAYVEAWWNVVNWEAVNAAFTSARARFHGGAAQAS